MDEKQRKEEKRKLKELRKELEEKIIDIIPAALKVQEPETVSEEKVEEFVDITDDAAKKIIEAVIFASSKPITAKELSKILKKFTPRQIEKLIDEIKMEYVAQERSFRMTEIAGGYEISTLPQYGIWIAKLEKEKKSKQASLAALETLAILAYKQPITRVEIEEIRGVDASGVIATLLDKGFISIAGRKEVPGRPLLYGTTERFLEHFGLKSLKDLPNIDEIKSLVEDTIKREELLRKENLVHNTEAIAAESAALRDEQGQRSVELEEKYEEISRQISDVTVLSERKVSDIINPQAPVEDVANDSVSDDEAVAPNLVEAMGEETLSSVAAEEVRENAIDDQHAEIPYEEASDVSDAVVGENGSVDAPGEFEKKED